MHSPITFAVAEGGFNPLNVNGFGNFVWTLVIFGLAAPFMWKLVFGKITAGLQEHEARASSAIVAAERASEEAEKARAAVEVALGEAQAEAAKLLSQARERAEVREKDIVAGAKQEADAMIESARSTIHAEQEKALSAIRAEVVEISLNAAGKVLGRSVDGEDDRRLVSELVGGSKGAQA